MRFSSLFFVPLKVASPYVKVFAVFLTSGARRREAVEIGDRFLERFTASYAETMYYVIGVEKERKVALGLLTRSY